ncbi:MAG TPA: DUF3768 domain-containing protein [Allosphingosinicella sp.]|nr:DUF3768 domain-containing protein [Allosphingosinicella sp.]
MTGLRSDRIRDLNDSFRRAGPSHGGWALTSGAQALGFSAVSQIVALIQTCAEFDVDNDPHGEHDFGSIEIEGDRIFWKIDYYDLELAFGSADPSDPAVTRRILTIMLASEY